MCTGGELKQHSLFTLSIYLSCLQEGTWDDVSGETFLRTLLAMPVQEAKYSVVCSPHYGTISECWTCVLRWGADCCGAGDLQRISCSEQAAPTGV